MRCGKSCPKTMSHAGPVAANSIWANACKCVVLHSPPLSPACDSMTSKVLFDMLSMRVPWVHNPKDQQMAARDFCAGSNDLNLTIQVLKRSLDIRRVRSIFTKFLHTVRCKIFQGIAELWLLAVSNFCNPWTERTSDPFQVYSLVRKLFPAEKAPSNSIYK